MTFALAFWILMLVWLIFGLAPHVGYPVPPWGSVLLLFVLFLLLGWKVFGAPLQ